MSEDQNIELSLTVREVNTILGAMGEVPAKISMGIIQKIQAQAGPQISEAPPMPSFEEVTEE